MQQLTEKQAITIFDSNIWQSWDDETVVRFQLFQDRLCMPFNRFHTALQRVLKRKVYTSELCTNNLDNIYKEYLGYKPAPTFDEIISLIPKDKLNIIEI